jgi:hypothetical protein
MPTSMSFIGLPAHPELDQPKEADVLDPPGTAPAWRVFSFRQIAMLSMSRVLPSLAATRMRSGPSFWLVTGARVSAWRTAT